MPTLDQLLAYLESEPEDPVIHFSVANAYRAAGRPIDAIRHYRLAAQYKQDYSAAWFEMARLAEETGELETARAAYGGAMAASQRAGDDHILKAAQVRLRRLDRIGRVGGGRSA